MPAATTKRKPASASKAAALVKAHSIVKVKTTRAAKEAKPSYATGRSAERSGMRAKILPRREQPPLSPRLMNAAAEQIKPPLARERVTAETWKRVQVRAEALGCPELQKHEREIARSVLEARDALVVGDCDESSYLAAALLLPQPTLVITPSPSSLGTRIKQLEATGFPAIRLDHSLEKAERNAALTRLAQAGSLLAFVSPETISATDFREVIAKSGVGQIIVKEAHCASEAAHEFRPVYTMLNRAFAALGAPPVLAVSRTLTREVVPTIDARLELRKPLLIEGPIVPDNVTLLTELARQDARSSRLSSLVAALPLPGLILCATPHDVDAVYATLRALSVVTYRCHTGMPANERSLQLREFVASDRKAVMVAMSAFASASGLPGLSEPQTDDAPLGYGKHDKRHDLRFIIHHQSPASLEQYVQELWLVGLDGQEAHAIMLHDSSHRSLHDVMLAQQRLRRTHVAELARGLESAASEGRTVTNESLALVTGQSRRTTDRLTSLLADAGILHKASGWIRTLAQPSQLAEQCERVGQMLESLQHGDARRLAAVTEYAESADCKLGFLSTYFGQGKSVNCGRCSQCNAKLAAELFRAAERPSDAKRRGAAQEFSVTPSRFELANGVDSAAARPLSTNHMA